MKKFLLFFVFIFILFTGCSITDKVIARYGNGNKIYLKQAVKEFNALDYENKARFNTIDDCFRFVRKIALEKIILEKSKKAKLNEDKTLTERLEKSKKFISYEILRKKNIFDKIKLTKEDYLKYSKRYSLYHIVKRTDIMNEAKVAESKKFLEKLSAEIKDFGMFKSYAKKYSEDVTSEDGGYIGEIRLGVMEDSIDNVIKKLALSKVSAVTESSNGMHIFYIDKVIDTPISELYKDKDLYEQVYTDKKNEVEEKWYELLMKDTSLKIHEESVKEKTKDDKVAIQYKSRKITRKDFFETVDQYRQGFFPEPTEDEILRLLKSIALDVVLEEKSQESKVTSSGEFAERVDKEKNFLMINEYIDRNLDVPSVEDKDIAVFYKQNIKTLFTFKQPDGRSYVQPLGEVTAFIKQKLEEKNRQDARYNLYRKAVDEEKLSIDDKVLSEFKTLIGK